MGDLRKGKVALIKFSEKLPTIKQMRQLLAAEALRRANGNHAIAARMLDLSQLTLKQHLKGEEAPRSKVRECSLGIFKDTEKSP